MKTIKYVKREAYIKDPLLAHSDDYPDAGYDLSAAEGCIIEPGSRATIDLGISFELPPATAKWKWEAQLRSRSGHRRNHGLVVHTATIDSGFRGFLSCVIFNHSTEPYSVESGERICQILFVKLPNVKLKSIKSFKLKAKRGINGFGSTGKK